MGIWIELGLFLGFIAFGFWQLHDVKKAQAHRRASAVTKAQSQPLADAANQPTEASEPGM